MLFVYNARSPRRATFGLRGVTSVPQCSGDGQVAPRGCRSSPSAASDKTPLETGTYKANTENEVWSGGEGAERAACQHPLLPCDCGRAVGRTARNTGYLVATMVGLFSALYLPTPIRDVPTYCEIDGASGGDCNPGLGDLIRFLFSPFALGIALAVALAVWVHRSAGARTLVSVGTGHAVRTVDVGQGSRLDGGHRLGEVAECLDGDFQRVRSVSVVASSGLAVTRSTVHGRRRSRIGVTIRIHTRRPMKPAAMNAHSACFHSVLM